MLDESRDERIELNEVWNLSWRFLGRFLMLGLLVGLVLAPFAIALYVLAFAGAIADYTPRETSDELIRHVQYWPAFLVLAIPIVVVDFALTFVTPALAYTTGSVDR